MQRALPCSDVVARHRRTIRGDPPVLTLGRDVTNFWFAGWMPIGRILVVGTLAYVALVVLIRVSGKRSLAQFTALDFVITVALGASFGRVLTARSVPIAEAVTAFALLVTLQVVVAKLTVNSPRFARFTTASPTLLYLDGQILSENLRRERVTDDELLGAVRKHGHGGLDDVAAIVMENDGSLTVIGDAGVGDGSALRRVAR